jgi:hypothetical protein
VRAVAVDRIGPAVGMLGGPLADALDRALRVHLALREAD